MRREHKTETNKKTKEKTNKNMMHHKNRIGAAQEGRGSEEQTTEKERMTKGNEGGRSKLRMARGERRRRQGRRMRRKEIRRKKMRMKRIMGEERTEHNDEDSSGTTMPKATSRTIRNGDDDQHDQP